MEVRRLKTKEGQRIWRVTWGTGGRYLGENIEGVWPRVAGNQLSRLSSAQEKYWRASNAGRQCFPNQDGKGFYWLIEGYAEVTIQIVKVALKSWKPMPRWAVLAIGNGWKPPKDWTPEKSRGETFEL